MDVAIVLCVGSNHSPVSCQAQPALVVTSVQSPAHTQQTTVMSVEVAISASNELKSQADLCNESVSVPPPPVLRVRERSISCQLSKGTFSEATTSRLLRH